MTIATPLFERLAAAYMRGAARSFPEMAVDSALLDAPLDALDDAELITLTGRRRSRRCSGATASARIPFPRR